MPSISGIYNAMRSELPQLLPRAQVSLERAKDQMTQGMKALYALSLKTLTPAAQPRTSNDTYFREARTQIKAAMHQPTLQELQGQTLAILNEQKQTKGDKLTRIKGELLNLKIQRVVSVMGCGALAVLSAVGMKYSTLMGLGGLGASLGMAYATYQRTSYEIEQVKERIQAAELGLQELEGEISHLKNLGNFFIVVNARYTERGASAEKRAQALIADLKSRQ